MSVLLHSAGLVESRSASVRTGVPANFTANFAGVAWTALVQVAFTPIYLRLMGPDAFGLVGFALTLQAVLQVLDLGLSPTVNRELARYSAQHGSEQVQRDFIATFGSIYWVLGSLIALAIGGCSQLVARQWLTSTTLPHDVLRVAVMLIAVLVGVQWPITFYQAALRGLERQVSLNAMKIGAVTAANAGTALALLYWSHDVATFFAMQIAAAVVHALALRLWTWQKIPQGAGARFDPTLVRRVWRFSAGMSTITAAAVIITQADKAVVSAMVPLQSFGYYTLGAMVASALFIVVSPVFNTLMPRFAYLAAAGDGHAIVEVYTRSIDIVGTAVAPVAITVSVFAFEIIRIWTGDRHAASIAAPVTSLLVIGTALNGVMNVPYALQLGEGWLRLAVRLTLMQGALYVPLLWLMTARFGMIGAAATWTLVNAIYVVVGLPLTQRRVMPAAESRRVVLRIAAAFTIASACGFAGRMMLRTEQTAMVTILCVTATLLVAASACAAASPATRRLLRRIG
jgi:O-antigen/teichoic acid export membrane protein